MKRINPANTLVLNDEFLFDPSAFEDLSAIGIHLVVLPGLKNETFLIINLSHVREFRMDADGNLQLKFINDLNNEWTILTAEQSDALLEKVQSVRELLMKQLSVK